MDIDWLLVGSHLLQLGLAYLLALPIAWDRERHERSAGLRTFPLVAVAACGYTLTGFQVLESSGAEGRLLAGLISGMGFIGGGAILKGRTRVTGTATAASLWSTGAIGMAVAVQRVEIAIAISAATFGTLYLLSDVKGVIRDDRQRDETGAEDET